MKLKPGYSKAAIAANIRALMSGRVPRERAISRAHGLARAAFRRLHARRELPSWIYPDPAQLAGGRSNPDPRLNPFDVQRGMRLFQRFVGRAPDASEIVAKPELPDALVCIGEISVIQYLAERDGKDFEFRHPFKAGSRPLLCVSPDGKLVLALGGAWTFTEDGFVDG